MRRDPGVQSPTGVRGGGAGNPGVNRSSGRFPDGANTDSNCADFVTQIATTLPVPSVSGATNVKVVSVTDFCRRADGHA